MVKNSSFDNIKENTVMKPGNDGTSTVAQPRSALDLRAPEPNEIFSNGSLEIPSEEEDNLDEEQIAQAIADIDAAHEV